MLLTVAAFVLVYEAAFVAVTHVQDKQSTQRFLRDMKGNGGDKNAIYFVNRYENHGERFLARVLKGYKIRAVNSTADFLNGAVPGDILYLEDNAQSEKVIQDGKLKIIERNSGYLTAGK
jgi:hypothetical protein